MLTDERDISGGGQELPQGSAPGKARPASPKKGGGFPKWAIWLIVIVVILVIAGAGAGVYLALSGGEEETVNQAPSITSLTADPDSLAPGEASTVTCVAEDLDGDALDYNWTATGGTVSGSGDTVTWIAPAVPKGYLVRVNVSDGKGGTAHDSVAVVVGIVAPTSTPTPASTSTTTSTTTSTPPPTAASTAGQGAIDIKSSPAGASVYIDGIDTGSITPYVATHVSEGDHVVLLRLFHYEIKTGIVHVSSGSTEYINWAMTYAPDQSVTLQPEETDSKDAYVYEDSPTINYGSLEKVYVSGVAAGEQLRTYIQFDLSSIPPDAFVLNANLGLYYHTNSSTTSSVQVGAYKVTGSWDEAVITWNAQPSVETTPVKTVTVPAVATNSFIYWDIKTLVQDWIHAIVPNNGVLLMDTDESTFEGWKYFYSSDWGTDSQRPKLTIVYYDPTP